MQILVIADTRRPRSQVGDVHSSSVLGRKMGDGPRSRYCDCIQYLEYMKRRTIDLLLLIVLAKMRIYLDFW